MRKVLFLLLATCLAAGGMAAVGCGSSSNNPPPPGGNDSGTDSQPPPFDSGPDTNPPPDSAVDAGCTFSGFVLGLISADAAQPSTDLGQNCVDDHDAADFASLF